METLASFFETINSALGVKSAGELVVHPVFLGFCVVAFIYFVLTRMKYFALTVGGLMGSAVIIHYLYPKNTSNLTELAQFLGAMGVFALLLVYFGFVRD